MYFSSLYPLQRMSPPLSCALASAIEKLGLAARFEPEAPGRPELDDLLDDVPLLVDLDGIDAAVHPRVAVLGDRPGEALVEATDAVAQDVGEADEQGKLEAARLQVLRQSEEVDGSTLLGRVRAHLDVPLGVDAEVGLAPPRGFGKAPRSARCSTGEGLRLPWPARRAARWTAARGPRRCLRSAWSSSRGTGRGDASRSPPEHSVLPAFCTHVPMSIAPRPWWRRSASLDLLTRRTRRPQTFDDTTQTAPVAPFDIAPSLAAEGEDTGSVRLGAFERHYESLFAAALEDGEISPQERKRLDLAARSLGLDSGAWRRWRRPCWRPGNLTSPRRSSTRDPTPWRMAAASSMAPPRGQATEDEPPTLTRPKRKKKRLRKREGSPGIPFHELHARYQEAARSGAVDDAWRIAEVLRQRGAATPEQSDFWQKHRQPGPIRPKHPLDAATATTGAATVTITGTSGSLTHSTTIALTVNASSATKNFTLSLSPSSFTVDERGSVSTTLTITSQGGFNSAVDLSVNEFPSGVSATAWDDPVTPPANGSTTVTITWSASRRAPTGTTTIELIGTSGSLTNEIPVTITVAP